MTQLAVAVLGPDRPGVFAALTEVLLSDGGNLEDASMTLLRGQFAMTLIVDVHRTVASIETALAPMGESMDLLISVRETSPDSDDLRPPSAPYVLRCARRRPSWAVAPHDRPVGQLRRQRD